VLGLRTAVNLQGAGMTDGWEPPSEAECQACWDGLKAKLATAKGLMGIDGDAKRDPISPKDPLERA
jgi:hypothetical protein